MQLNGTQMIQIKRIYTNFLIQHSFQKKSAGKVFNYHKSKNLQNLRDKKKTDFQDSFQI